MFFPSLKHISLLQDLFCSLCRFVMMATVDQCTEAIKNVNGFRIGNDRLIVEFAKSQEEKDRDRREKEVCYSENVSVMCFVPIFISRRSRLTQ